MEVATNEKYEFKKVFINIHTEEETYSEEELISPHSDCPSSGVSNN